jgi:signal transduction histidine kinase
VDDGSVKDLGAAMRRAQPDEVEVVLVSVRDTGPGISQKVLKNLFIPFFTTKERGTGLGLAISQSLVQNAGGTIDVQTQSGAGTTFTILLPVSRGIASEAPKAEVAVETPAA